MRRKLFLMMFLLLPNVINAEECYFLEFTQKAKLTRRARLAAFVPSIVLSYELKLRTEQPRRIIDLVDDIYVGSGLGNDSAFWGLDDTEQDVSSRDTLVYGANHFIGVMLKWDIDDVIFGNNNAIRRINNNATIPQKMTQEAQKPDDFERAIQETKHQAYRQFGVCQENK